MSDEQFWSSYLDDIIAWADEIAGEWDGNEPGRQEDRGHQANDIIQKAQELQQLLLEMSKL